MQNTKPAFQFVLPSLARPTYAKLKEMLIPGQISQWDIVTLAIYVLDDLRKRNPQVGEESGMQLIQRIRDEVKNLKPSTGKPKRKADWLTGQENQDNFNEEIDRENGE